MNRHDTPFCASIESDGYIYSVDQRHDSGKFLKSELIKMQKAITKTLKYYKENNIKDEDIIQEDKKNMNEFLNSPVYSVKTTKNKKSDNLYLIKDVVNDTLKIGRSVNAKQRLKSLQVSSPNRLELLYEIEGMGDKENNTHLKFKDLRLASEWFKFDESIIKFFKYYEI